MFSKRIKFKLSYQQGNLYMLKGSNSKEQSKQFHTTKNMLTVTATSNNCTPAESNLPYRQWKLIPYRCVIYLKRTMINIQNSILDIAGGSPPSHLQSHQTKSFMFIHQFVAACECITIECYFTSQKIVLMVEILKLSTMEQQK